MGQDSCHGEESDGTQEDGRYIFQTHTSNNHSTKDVATNKDVMDLQYDEEKDESRYCGQKAPNRSKDRSVGPIQGSGQASTYRCSEEEIPLRIAR
mmetsp:Transcript_4829/g.9217  ORF Transcript_4829/g.9217 Transcript_4829/m.9217 type:complete len:95 (+) Transcript_4829:738-1022(+)